MLQWIHSKFRRRKITLIIACILPCLNFQLFTLYINCMILKGGGGGISPEKKNHNSRKQRPMKIWFFLRVENKFSWFFMANKYSKFPHNHAINVYSCSTLTEHVIKAQLQRSTTYLRKNILKKINKWYHNNFLMNIFNV